MALWYLCCPSAFPKSHLWDLIQSLPVDFRLFTNIRRLWITTCGSFKAPELLSETKSANYTADGACPFLLSEKLNRTVKNLKPPLHSPWKAAAGGWALLAPKGSAVCSQPAWGCLGGSSLLTLSQQVTKWLGKVFPEWFKSSGTSGNFQDECKECHGTETGEADRNLQGAG